MKVFRWLLLVSLLAPAIVVAGASSALACRCIAPRPDHKALKDATAVFTGTMVEAERGAEIGVDPVTWTFAVETVYKGDVEELQKVTSHTQGTACGLIFKEETRYVVFAHDGGKDPRSDSKLATNSCENTRRLSATEEPDLQTAARPGAAQPSPDDERHDDVVEPTGWDPFVVGSLAIVVVFGIVTVVALATGRRQ